MKRRGRRSWKVVLGVGVVALAGCVPEPVGPVSIGANQTFRGEVNGQGDGAVVTTVCGGPTWPGRLGPVLGGQTVAAVQDPAGPGNTGDNAAVFVEPNGTMQVVSLRAWGEAVELPTDVQVPCDGTGVMVFDPCFGFVGCRGGAQAAVVKVTFVNIAD